MTLLLSFICNTSGEIGPSAPGRFLPNEKSRVISLEITRHVDIQRVHQVTAIESAGREPARDYFQVTYPVPLSRPEAASVRAFLSRGQMLAAFAISAGVAGVDGTIAIDE